jgi:hypothetical protein
MRRLAREFAGVSALVVSSLLVSPALVVRTAHAGEADDLQDMIDRARHGASDLERLDDKAAAREDVALMREWLNEAWRLRADSKYDEARDILKRCDAQAEMIRQKITAGKLSAEADAKEAELRAMREQIEKTRQAIRAAIEQKAALQARTK